MQSAECGAKLSPLQSAGATPQTPASARLTAGPASRPAGQETDKDTRRGRSQVNRPQGAPQDADGPAPGKQAGRASGLEGDAIGRGRGPAEMAAGAPTETRSGTLLPSCHEKVTKAGVGVPDEQAPK